MHGADSIAFPNTLSLADRLHSTYLMDIAAQEAPALAQPNSAEAARSNDAPAPASRNQASGSSLPDPLAATTRNQVRLSTAFASLLQGQSHLLGEVQHSVLHDFRRVMLAKAPYLHGVQVG